MRSEIEAVLKSHSSIIKSYKITKDFSKKNKYIFELKVVLKNETKLENREAITLINDIIKRNYKYQWMRSDNSLIVRWDNAPHHPSIDTFPHHMHVGKNSNVKSSKEMILAKVLNFIKNFKKAERS